CAAGTISPMPNIATLLKNEITRMARKEVRAQTQGLKKAIAPYRAEIAALKRSTKELELQVRRLTKAAAKTASAAAAATEEPARAIRFSAGGLAAQRRRLGLSANECGLLVGASGQSIYKWEDGKARPRAAHLPGIAALRSLGKRDAAARLKALSPSAR
ncbi:MAG: hypothetical protein ACREWJ_01880, partial [Rhodoferax sp.]